MIWRLPCAKDTGVPYVKPFIRVTLDDFVSQPSEPRELLLQSTALSAINAILDLRSRLAKASRNTLYTNPIQPLLYNLLMEVENVQRLLLGEQKMLIFSNGSSVSPFMNDKRSPVAVGRQWYYLLIQHPDADWTLCIPRDRVDPGWAGQTFLS